MRLANTISPIQIKRAFVIADRAKKEPISVAKRKVLSMSERSLNKIIGRKRRAEYENALWRSGSVRVSDVGAWRGAGGLPLSWTMGSIKDTARLVKKALAFTPKKLKKRSRYAIPGIL